MRAATATAATTTTPAGLAGGSSAVATTRREHGKLLGKFCRIAVRAGGSLPFSGPDQDFAVPAALLAMKFVNRHAEKINDFVKSSRGFGSRRIDLKCLVTNRPGGPVSSVGWCAGKSLSRRDIPTIARRFNAGNLAQKYQVPKGLLNCSIVPSGRDLRNRPNPALKCGATINGSFGTGPVAPLREILLQSLRGRITH